MLNKRKNKRTGLVKHLVTFVKDEHADASETQGLVADEGLETTRSTDNDMGASILVLEGLHVGLDGRTTVEDASLDVWHVLAEAVVLIANLVGQFTSVAHHHNGDFAVDGLDLLKSGENKDGSLTQT